MHRTRSYWFWRRCRQWCCRCGSYCRRPFTQSMHIDAYLLIQCVFIPSIFTVNCSFRKRKPNVVRWFQGRIKRLTRLTSRIQWISRQKMYDAFLPIDRQSFYLLKPQLKIVEYFSRSLKNQHEFWQWKMCQNSIVVLKCQSPLENT